MTESTTEWIAVRISNVMAAVRGVRPDGLRRAEAEAALSELTEDITRVHFANHSAVLALLDDARAAFQKGGDTSRTLQLLSRALFDSSRPEAH